MSKEFFCIKLYFPSGHVAYCIDTAYDSYHQGAINAQRFTTAAEANEHAVGHIRHFKVNGFYQIEKFMQP